jgi:hypothetical protein
MDPSDPDLQALAQNIRETGQLEPIVISQDWVIISGHRRFAALKIIGATSAKVREWPIRSTDPRFAELLVSFNAQRVKTAEETLREQVVRADPEEAYRALQQHRRERAEIDIEAEAIAIEGVKKRRRISDAKMPMLRAAIAIVEQRKAYWPLTDRQIHYALLNNPPLRHAKKPSSTYVNDRKSYKDLCDLLTRARLARDIPFSAIDDPTRPYTVWGVHDHVGPFIEQEIDAFLKGYYRNLLQSQPNHVEILGEKNTIQNIIRPVAEEFCLPMTLGRGYSSLPPRQKMAQRFRGSGKERLVLLILSDFDPEGEDIGHSFARSMRDDFSIREIVPIKVALTAEQVEEMALPPVLKAKEGSSRRGRFVERHGEHVHELEAVPPDGLQHLLRDAIENVLDIAAFNGEIDKEKEDAAYLAGVRRTIHDVLKGHLNDG